MIQDRTEAAAVAHAGFKTHTSLTNIIVSTHLPSSFAPFASGTARARRKLY